MNKTLTYQSKAIFYRCIGSGEPVILIHGFGEDGEVWKAQADFLKDHLIGLSKIKEIEPQIYIKVK